MKKFTLLDESVHTTVSDNTIPVSQKEEAKTVEGERSEQILRKIADICIWDDNGGSDFKLDNVSCEMVVSAMQAYSSQQNTALIEENERLKNLINDLHSSLNNWPGKYSILEMVDLTNLNKIK